MMLHLRPDLVNMDKAVDQINANPHPLGTKDMHHRGMLFRPVDFNRHRAPSGVAGMPSDVHGGKWSAILRSRIRSPARAD